MFLLLHGCRYPNHIGQKERDKMQLVIEISDGLYNNLGTIKNGSIASKIILDCVRKGQALPKGHGRIADVDKMLEEMRVTRTYDVLFALERVKPIIEADKGD